MANSPEHPHIFRAPPPSPIAHRRSSVVNEDEISDFLEHSLRIPNLILPDQIFPKETQVKNLPEIDFLSFISSKTESISSFLESVASTGCVQLVNHGISGDLIRSVLIAASGIFGLPPENKKNGTGSSEESYGFEEFDSEEDIETTEEFVWSRDEGLKSMMDGIRLQGFPCFSKQMEILSTDIENIAQQVLSSFFEHAQIQSPRVDDISYKQELSNMVCYLHKHHKYTSVRKCDASLKLDFIRMLIRGTSGCSHSMCVHVCDSSSEFHVYSKKGWISFTPSRDAIVMTIGDQIQEYSNGNYKNVIGRPIFKGGDEEPISMAFMYSHSTITQSHGNKGKNISLWQQLMLALFLTLVYHFWVCFYSVF
ncbi:hypothetical protein ACHQM5_002040 [Ranunculus cassubicifolius]